MLNDRETRSGEQMKWIRTRDRTVSPHTKMRWNVGLYDIRDVFRTFMVWHRVWVRRGFLVGVTHQAERTALSACQSSLCPASVLAMVLSSSGSSPSSTNRLTTSRSYITHGSRPPCSHPSASSSCKPEVSLPRLPSSPPPLPFLRHPNREGHLVHLRCVLLLADVTSVSSMRIRADYGRSERESAHSHSA